MARPTYYARVGDRVYLVAPRQAFMLLFWGVDVGVV